MKELIVLKYGSDSVTNGRGMDQQRVDGYAEQAAELHARHGLIIVTSGAVAVGAWRWQQAGRDPEVADKQVLAAHGSAGANIAWEQALDKVGILAGQGLATHLEIDDPGEGGVLVKALRKMLKEDTVPVMNENDLLSDQELKKLTYGGDNDGLATHIAIRLAAKKLFFMTNVEGLHSSTGLVHEINFARGEQKTALALAGESSGHGTGGMLSKVSSALDAAAMGIEAYIAQAGTPFPDIISGQAGTHIVARSGLPRVL